MVKRYPCGPKFAKVVVFNFVVSINFYHSKQSNGQTVRGCPFVQFNAAFDDYENV